MLQKSSECLVAAQIGFLIFLIPCIFLVPEIFRQDLGISNYGINRLTVVPYTLGFVTSAYFTWRSAQKTKRAGFRRNLIFVAILQLGLLAVPDSQTDLIRYLHIAIGMVLFTTEFFVAAWLTLYVRREFNDYALLILQALAGFSAFLSLGQILPFEAPSQLVFQITFGIICIRAARALERQKY